MGYKVHDSTGSTTKGLQGTASRIPLERERERKLRGEEDRQRGGTHVFSSSHVLDVKRIRIYVISCIV